MSFAGTPLGQGRRLDHNTFLGKPPSNSNRPTSPHRIPPNFQVPFASAPVLGSRSPPKSQSSSSARERNPPINENNDDESALVRYNRLKQQQQKSNSNLDPEKWSVKDTTVNIAAALHQAVERDVPPMNPNNTAWASGRPTSNVPRSTSVEYEAQSQSTGQRRLAPPPNRLAPPSRTKVVKPLSKSVSQRTIPDSEEEPSQSIENGRGKSPFAAVLDVAHRTYEKATYYARQRSPVDQENGSYDYSAEERDYQSNISKRNFAAHKRNKMSMDNKAYKPSVESEEEEFDDNDSDSGRRRRRKKKKNDSAGATLSLPVISAEKRRRKRKGKGGAGEEGSESEEEQVEERPHSRPASRAGSRAGSVPRLFPDSSLDVDQRLTHIPEEQDEEAGYTDLQSPESSHDFSHGPSGDYSEASFSQPQDNIGGKLGKLVFNLWMFIMSCISIFFHIIGKVIGMVVDILLVRPVKFVSRINLAQVKPYVVLAVVIVLVGYLSQRSLLDPLTPWTRGGKINYAPPDIPAADIAELNKRLQSIESALSGIIYETEQSKIRSENGDRSRLELVSRLGNLEGLVKKDMGGRMSDMERAVAAGQSQRESEGKRVITEMRREMETLKEIVDVLQHRPPPPSSRGETIVGNDEEARVKLKALEERVGSVEGGVKEAIEHGKNAVKSDSNSAWWNKIPTGKKMTIKSSDGQDVTSLIGNLVENAVISFSNKDVLSRADFALHSAGARIVPRLTSPTYELRAPSKTWQLLGFLGSGNGIAIGRPPVTALHHEVHNGYCWPFAGTEGNLGVNLVQPTLIDAISIDHVAREVATDVRSAPRHMEVWGMIDGKDNFEKVQQIVAERERRRQEAAERGEQATEDVGFGVPGWMSRREEGLFVRIAEFAYDVLSEKTVQTFPVYDDVRQSHLDFGTVVLRIKDNWGQEGFTCVYRFRVHGELLVQPPPLLAETETS
ncbi:hypothetical protein L218DRAFT_970674 [Marasmius fiardii PR-910]|nr:hypothetical protein L218DRAFT_970674 [Marasmius fiardii PR-910]